MGDAEWEGLESEDEDQQENERSEGWSGRSSFIFVVDCSKDMFDTDAGRNGESLFVMAIQCAAAVMKNRIISCEKDLMAVMFYGTEQSNADVASTFVFQDLEEPGAETVLKLNELLKGNQSTFIKTYGYNKSFSLSDVLWKCMSIFSKCTMKLASRRIVLFTCEDNPHYGNDHLRRQVLQKVQDIHENGIELELIDLKAPGESFDINKFYKNVLVQEDLDKRPMASDKLDELLLRVRRKDYKKRTLGSIKFSLPGDLSFSVKLYNLVQELKKPFAVRLAKDTNEEVHSITKTFLEETGEILLPTDILQNQEYGGKTFSFTSDETKEIKQLFDTGLCLLGFKPKSFMKTYYHIKPAGFLYPDDENIMGSTRIFSALLQRCIEREVLPICRMFARKNTAPDIVALFPQKEEFDANNVQITPPGFHVIHLPFADDIRALDMVALSGTERSASDLRASEAQIELAKDVVKKLQFNFKSENFENPVLQTHWRNIEALALDLDEPEEMTDYTMPLYDAMDKRAGLLIDAFKAELYPHGDCMSQEPKKRKTAANDREPKDKKSKVDISQIDFEAEAKSGKVHNLTVDVLKNFCVTINVKVAGKKKSVLIDAILQHFGLN